MKKSLLFLFIAVICLGMIYSSPCMANDVGNLIDKLVEKGILSDSEALQLLQEAQKEDAKEKEELKQAAKDLVKEAGTDAFGIPEWIKRIKAGGDLRLRHDTQWRKTENDDYDRNRERFRIRLGIRAKVTDTTEIGVRLASGSGYQNTTNQSYDNHARGKEIFIDRAYASWKPYDFFKITGGKHKNSLFTSSLVWDSDINPEGFFEHLNFDIIDRVNIFSNLGQCFIEELNLKDSDRDPALLIFQLGSIIKSFEKIKIELAGTYYNFKNLDELEWKNGLLSNKTEFLGYNNNHSQQMIFSSDGKLLNQFKCLGFDAKIKITQVLPMPFSIFGSYIYNKETDIEKLIENGVDPGDSDPDKLKSYAGDDRDSGWQVGISLGKKKKKGDWYVKYFYQELEDYAFPAAFVDSDFHGGGTNNKGHYIQLRYFLMDNIQARATGFFTGREDEDKDGQKDEDRLQLDMVIKF